MEATSASQAAPSVFPPGSTAPYPVWTIIPLELRLKIFCQAAKENAIVFAACRLVCREWRICVSPLLNLARLHQFANALAANQQPPASLMVREASKRMASQLENPCADHQRAYTDEWLGMTKLTIQINFSTRDVFRQYRFSDLQECMERENELLKPDNSNSCKDDELSRLADRYWEAGHCEKAVETILRMDFFRKLFELFDAKQWDRGIEYITHRPWFNLGICEPLLSRYILEKKLSRALAVLRLLADDKITHSHLSAIFQIPPVRDQYDAIVKVILDTGNKSWYYSKESLLLSLANLLVDAGRGDLVTMLPKVCPYTYKDQLYEFFKKWFALNRCGLSLPPDKEIQAVTDLLKNPFFCTILLDWTNLLIDCARYRMALDALKHIKPGLDEKKYAQAVGRFAAWNPSDSLKRIKHSLDEKKYAETLNRFAAHLGCRESDVFGNYSFQKRLELLESALKRKEVACRPKPRQPRTITLRDSVWTDIPMELRLKIICLAAKENATVFAACTQVCTEWRVHVGPLLNLARLRLFANALAAVQQPPASLAVREASNRMASQLENPDAKHQSAFTNEWMGMTKMTILRNHSTEQVFQKYRFSDLKECMEIEDKLLKTDNPGSKNAELSRLAKHYWLAGACEKADETVLRMDFFRKLFELFDSKQWDKGMEHIAQRPILDKSLCMQLLDRYILEKNLTRALAVLLLFADKGIDHSHFNAIFQIPPEQDLLPADKEIQAVTDHLKLNSFFLDWTNLLIHWARYRKALDALKRFKPRLDEKKHTETLSKFASHLGCDRGSVSFENFSLKKRLELLESAIRRMEVPLPLKPSARSKPEFK